MYTSATSNMSNGEWSEEIKQAVALLKANEFQVVPNFPHRICLLGAFNNHVQQIGQLLAEKKEMQGQLDAYKAKYWFCEGECGKGFCFDEWDGHHEEEDITPFWCRECLKKAETLLYLTEEEMAEEEEESN